MRRVYIAAFLLLTVTGCATIQEAHRLDGGMEYAISCWYFDWNMCYDKANQLCGGRHSFLAQDEGINGKELWIVCPDVK